MRNSEGYIDPTASRAMKPWKEEKLLKSITAPQRKKPVKKQKSEKKIEYYSTPAYISK